jgi:hypothetical protein
LAQDVSASLDTAYKLSNKQETELFKEKQKYIFAAFEKTLKLIKAGDWSDHISMTMMHRRYSGNC